MDLTLASTLAKLLARVSSTATCTLSPDTKVMCQIRKAGWGELFRVNRSIDIKNYKYISSILFVSQIIIIFADAYQKVLQTKVEGYMTKREISKLFEDRKIRTVWDDKEEKWYLSIVEEWKAGTKVLMSTGVQFVPWFRWSAKMAKNTCNLS